MANNDPRKNTSNLLFKPNNAIDDEQPAFFFYSKPETPPQTAPDISTSTETNVPIGQNQNIYAFPAGSQILNPESNVNPPNIWDSIPSYANTYRSDTVPTSIPTFAPSDVPANPTLHSSGISFDSAPPIPLFSASNIPIKPAVAEHPPIGSLNNYRRIGTKKPVYAPIPGLSNPNQVAQFDVQRQLTPPNSIFPPHETSNLLAPLVKTVPKDLCKSIDSTQTNSPFLNPVTEVSVLPHTEAPISCPTMPIMSTNEVQYSTPNLMYSSDPALSKSTQIVSTAYRPPYHHWFYKKEIEGRVIWEPFSMIDSLNLESNFTSHDLTPEKNIPTDGGRYDVNILRRQRTSVYWNSKPTEVRRCSWFHKGHTDGKYSPFEENIATKLEEEYKCAVEANQWHTRISLPNGEIIMFHSADVFVCFSSSQFLNIDNASESQTRPRVVKRGMDEYNIDEGESDSVDHLLFMVHGIGAGCDLKFRSVEEVVEDFRSVALQLVRTHYRSSCERKIVNRIEILPISWHEKLHSEDTGIDNKLKSITLESIPKLREFTNDTLLDILFYTSPIYGQTIISSVGNELNRVYDLFTQRNPNFTGSVSLAGHSLGSLILFDILCHQSLAHEETELSEEDVSPSVETKPHPLNRKLSRRVSYMMGKVGTGQAQINYPLLNFQPVTFFALGSPIGMFVTIRGLDNLGEKFALPTCPGFFNIFHPYDPVAYRIESLINPQLANVKPVLIPHHKGRKRMHLELKETMAKVGSDLKQKLVDSMKNTWNSIFQLGWSNNNNNNKQPIQPAIADEVDKVLEQFANKHTNIKENEDHLGVEATGLNLGMLNTGRRIDYVLQEAPVEFFNEYIFALSSHVCYWESEDTVLLILKEIYNMLNIAPDCQIPQQTLTIERPPSSSRTPDISTSTSQIQIGMDPTAPMKREASVGPPPLSGFVKES